MEDKKRRNHPVERLGRAFFGRDNDFQVSYTPSSSGKYNIYLYGEIEDARQFQDAIEAMNDAGEDDLVIIHLSTNGGSTDATDTFISCMRRCKARVIVEASGGVHSAGTIILMNAREYRLSENFNALIHNGSFGTWGKSSDAKQQFEFQAQYMDRLAWATYEGFLTDEEIEQLIAGKDFWLGPEEWVDRWKRRQEFLKNEISAEEDSDEETTTETVDEEVEL